LAASFIAGAAALSQQVTGADETAKPPESVIAKPTPEVKRQAVREKSDSTEVSAEVSGRVVDPDGRPVAGARMLFHQQRPYGELPDFFPESVTGTTDGHGRFRLFGSVHQNLPSRDRQPRLTVLAHVPGYGPAATAEASSADALQDRTLQLVPADVPSRGRILNVEGKPIPGVTVRPIAVVANAANDLGGLITAIETNTWAKLPDDQRGNIVFSAAMAGLTQ